MAAVTICCDLGAAPPPPNLALFPLFPHLFATKWWDQIILVFWMLSFKPTFSLSSFTFIKGLFSSSSVSAIRVASSAYLRLLIFLLAVLIIACDSCSPAFHMMYSAYKLNALPTFSSKAYKAHASNPRSCCKYLVTPPTAVTAYLWIEVLVTFFGIWKFLPPLNLIILLFLAQQYI